MADFLDDAFTDADATVLSSHTASPTGGAWTFPSGFGFGGNLRIFDNSLFANAGGVALNLAYNAATPPSADYTVTVLVAYDPSGGTETCEPRLVARYDTAIDAFYLAGYSESAGKWQIYYYEPDVVLTLLGEFTESQPSADFTMTLTVTGTSISVAKDGVVKVAVTDSTLTAAGKAGVCFTNNAGGGAIRYAYRSVTAGPVSGPVANVASATSISTGACTISGTAATSGTSPYDYQLQRGTDNVTFGTDVGSLQTNKAGAPDPQADSGLTNGSVYYYRWKNIDDVGNIVYSPGIPVVPHAAGSTFYVATGGSDSANGLTTGTPWQTITRANLYLAGSVLAGDSLVFNGGQTFAGNLLVQLAAVSNPPTSGSPLTIGSYGTGRATIDADDSYPVWLQDVEYVTIDNLILLGSGVTSGGVTTNTESGVKAVLTGSSDLHEIIVQNCDISGFGGAGLALGVEDAAGVFVDCALLNCVIYEILGYGLTTYKLPSPTLSPGYENLTVSGNDISLCYGNGGNAGYGLFLSNLDGGEIHSNYIHECGENSGGGAGGPCGILTSESDGVHIHHNEIDRQYTGEVSDGFGIDTDNGSRNCIVEDNYIHDCDGPALVDFYINSAFSQNNNNTFRFNVCQNNGRRTIATPGNHNATFLAIIAGGGVGPTNTKVYNNTSYDQNATGADTNAIKDQSTSGAVIRDNIIILDGSGRTVGVIAASTVLNPNRYYARNSAAISGTDGGSSFADFAALQGLGQEAGGSSGNPDLDDIGNAGGAYPLGDFSTLTEYDPTTSAIWDGGANVQAYAGPDFHGLTMPAPGSGEYPFGAVGIEGSAVAGRSLTLLGVG